MAKLGRTFVQMDVNWYDEWGYLLSVDAVALWPIAMTLCKRLQADGILTKTQLQRNSPFYLDKARFDQALSELLNTQEAPVDDMDSASIILRGWTAWNDSSDEIAAKKAGGKYGNHLKWHAKTPKEGCEHCFPVAASDTDVGTESLTESNRREEQNREEQNREEKTLNKAPDDKPSGRRRSPDLIFEALADEWGRDFKNLTRTERQKINDATKQAKDVKATPEDIRIRSARYRLKWPTREYTPHALMGAWTSLAKDSSTKGTFMTDRKYGPNGAPS